MLPYTGWGADDARNFEAGLTLAAEEINAEYGGVLGRPLRVPLRGHQGDHGRDRDLGGAAPDRPCTSVHAIINGYNSLVGAGRVRHHRGCGHPLHPRQHPVRPSVRRAATTWTATTASSRTTRPSTTTAPGLIYFLDELERTGQVEAAQQQDRAASRAASTTRSPSPRRVARHRGAVRLGTRRSMTS